MKTIGLDWEAQVIQRAQSGDERAIGLLIEAYRPVLMALALRKLRNVDDASDAVQETFVKAIRGLKDFDNSRAIKPWLSRICMNCIVDAARQRKTPCDSLDKHEYILSDNRVSEESAERTILNGQVVEAIKRLPWRYRQIIEMRHFDHLDVTEIAVRLAKPEGTIKSWLFRARALLQRDLAPSFA